MSLELKVAAFVVISIGLVWLSRASLRDIRSHGFYRYFAWEAILLLALLNVEVWLKDPFSFHQIISWVLLIACSYSVVHGLILLKKMGRPDPGRNDPTLMGIEKTTRLVTTGIYRFVRHPIYGSLILLAWGIAFKQLSWLNASLALIATPFLTMTAKVEEAENVRYFGNEYLEYMKRTKLFIPFLF